MNECNSDSVQLSKAIRKGNYDILKLYSDMLSDIELWSNEILLCCTESNGNYELISDALDVLISNLIDCCQAINDLLDDIIDTYQKYGHVEYFIEHDNYLCEQITEDEIPIKSAERGYTIKWGDFFCEQLNDAEWPQPVFGITFGDYLCSQLPEEDFVIDYIIAFDDYFCVQTETPDPSLIDYQIEYGDFICRQNWECDIEAAFSDCIVVPFEYTYIAVWSGYVCMQESDVITTTTTEEYVTTTEEFVSTTTPEEGATTTTEEEQTTTSTEVATTTTEEIICDVQFTIVEIGHGSTEYTTTTTT